MTRDEIFGRVREILVGSFEIDAAAVTPKALLFQELGLDSIDAIDMVVRLQEWTGRRVPEEALRKVRTVDDIVTLVEAHLAQGQADAEGEGAAKSGRSGDASG
jgi:acyl carrier protein